MARHRHQHGLARLSRGRHFDRDEGAFYAGMWYLNRSAWRSRGYIHHCGWSRRYQRLRWWLPAARLTDRALLARVRVELHHSAKVVDVVLASEVELGCREA